MSDASQDGAVPSAAPAPPPLPPGSLNYYNPTAPVSAGDAQCWRRGNVLVTPLLARLPRDWCVKCGEASDGEPLRKQFSWHPPLLALLIIFPGLIVYAIVAVIVQKKATVEVPLCARHRARRRNAILVGWLGSLGSLGLLFFDAAQLQTGWLIVVGIVGFLAAIVVGMVGSRPLTPQKIDTRNAYFKGVSPAYLDHIPS